MLVAANYYYEIILYFFINKYYKNLNVNVNNKNVRLSNSLFLFS
jgi:hypothetical protein